MATPSSGSISFKDIIKEFGNITDNDQGNDTTNPDKVKLGSYRVNKNVDNIYYPLDDDVPNGTTGQKAISFADLRGKRLNVVVRLTSGKGGVSAKDKYGDSGGAIVIGGGCDKREKGSRIHILARGIYKSEQGTHRRGDEGEGNRWHCALRTGSWSSPESVDIRIGTPSGAGYVRGGGGNGGEGGTQNKSDKSEIHGQDGCNGTSALGIEQNIRQLRVYKGSIIQAGGGGGGGGGGAAGEQNDAASNETSGGGGGGGGMGDPFGERGEAGSGNSGQEVTPADGVDGTTSVGGNGGRGGSNHETDEKASSAAGGGGAGGGITHGEGGAGGPGPGGADTDAGTAGADGGEIDEGNPSDIDERGIGGNGGRGAARGKGQREGEGGLGGLPGGAIVYGNKSFTLKSGETEERIYGGHYAETPN